MSKQSDSTASSATLHRACTGESTAWAEIVMQYTPRVYCWCRKASIPEQDTVDLSQDVLAQLFVSLPTLTRERANGDSLSAWLFTVTRNKIRDYFRRQGRSPFARGGVDFAQLAAPASSSAEVSTRILRMYDILDAVRSDVESRTWQAFWRLAVDGDPAEVIAQDLKMSAGAVRQAKLRVLQKLRDEGL